MDSNPDIMDIPDDENDTITASYQVFIQPSLPLGRRLLVLQQPNRTDDAARPPPTEMRLKAHTGMIEVDVPLDHSVAYDRENGLKWGRTLQNSMTAKNGGSHGLAGGFGIGGVLRGGGGAGGGAGRKKADAEDDDLDWTEAVRQDKVLRTQTLGGQYPDTKEVQYMVGVFQGKDLHLTPVSDLVHLRPQLHHIDATVQAAAAAAGKDSSSASPAGPARAIHMSVKTTADGDTVATETMADRLRYVQSEPWRKMRYTDENEEAAWDTYNESLFLRPAEGDQDEGQAEEGKGKEAATEDEKPLQESVPSFVIHWDDDRYLEAISGIKKPEPQPEREVVKEDPRTVAPAPAAPTILAEEPRRPKMRLRGGSAIGTARRGARSKAPES